MRILPIALVEPTATTTLLVKHAHRSSRITHGAPACLAACALYVLVVHELMSGAEPPAALDRSINRLRAVYKRLRDPAITAALDTLLAWPTRSGRGHVSDSFWSAWDAFAEADGYRPAVVRAVKYGNDTDTTAAIAGGLAGSFWGINSIPSVWLKGLRGKEVVQPLVWRLVRRVDPNREPPLPEMDPDFLYSTDDIERIQDNHEWHRIHDRPRPR